MDVQRRNLHWNRHDIPRPMFAAICEHAFGKGSEGRRPMRRTSRYGLSTMIHEGGSRTNAF